MSEPIRTMGDLTDQIQDLIDSTGKHVDADDLQSLLDRVVESPIVHLRELPRFGLQWAGPEDPIAVPMTDGYWTPWHLAVQAPDPAAVVSPARMTEVEEARRERAEVMLADIKEWRDRPVDTEGLLVEVEGFLLDLFPAGAEAPDRRGCASRCDGDWL